jgi:hypothetical protein
MRILTAILICAEVYLVLVLVAAPVMTSHKVLSAAVNRYKASPSPETETEMNTLRQIAQAHDRKQMITAASFLAVNTVALLGTLLLIRKQNARLRAKPITGLLPRAVDRRLNAIRTRRMKCPERLSSYSDQ